MKNLKYFIIVKKILKEERNKEIIEILKRYECESLYKYDANEKKVRRKTYEEIHSMENYYFDHILLTIKNYDDKIYTWKNIISSYDGLYY